MPEHAVGFAAASRKDAPCYPAKLTFGCRCVQKNIMRTAKLHDALRNLAEAIRDVESAVAEMKADRDPLASHIFGARRQYRTANATKSGKRREVAARLTYTRACELGFHGSLDEWERLMGAASGR